VGPQINHNTIVILYKTEYNSRINYVYICEIIHVHFTVRLVKKIYM
jgi:hypothetical protein